MNRRTGSGGTRRVLALAAGLGLVATAVATPTPITFQGRRVYVPGNHPRGIAFADFNRDGARDMVVANGQDDTVATFLGIGGGAFGPRTTLATGRYPIAVATGDFDRDGNPDFAVACFQHSTSAGTVELHFGNGLGAFPRRATLTADINPLKVHATDVDGDGITDLVVLNYYPGGYTVYRGNGIGGFTRLNPTQVRTGNNVHWSDVGDVNGDGRPDLAMANSFSRNVTVHLNVGGGAFGPAVWTGTFAANPYGVSFGDVDGDGNADLGVVSSGRVDLFYGGGNGTFVAGPTVFNPAYNVVVTLADLNGDAYADVAIAGPAVPASYVDVVPGNVRGSLGVLTRHTVGHSPYLIVPDDVDADGRPDLAVADSGVYGTTTTTSSVSILHNSTVLPNIAPTAVAGTDFAAECDAGGTSVTLDGSGSFDADGDPLTYRWIGDFVGGTATGATPTVTFTGGPGVHVVGLVVNDGVADSQPDAVTVTIRDTTPPVVTAPANVTAECSNAAGQAVSLGTPTASDRAGPVTVTNDAPTLFRLGTTRVTWTATDGAGLTATAVQTVIVVDTTPPTITAPANVTAECTNAAGQAVSLGTPTAADIAGAVTVTNDAPALFRLGTTRVTWTATDGAGLTATAVQTVIVVDTTPPTITAPANVTVECSSAAGQAVSLGTPTAADVAGAVTVTNDAPALFRLGTTVVTWTATDGAGLTATATQSVRVIDTTAPVLTVTGVPQELWPANHKMVRIRPTVTLSDAADSAPALTLSVTSSEPDDGQGDGDTEGDVVVRSPTDFDLRAERSGSGSGRTYTLTWTATDRSGNTRAVTIVVRVPHSQGGSR